MKKERKMLVTFSTLPSIFDKFKDFCRKNKKHIGQELTDFMWQRVLKQTKEKKGSLK